jgi:hypothetical protein
LCPPTRGGGGAIGRVTKYCQTIIISDIQDSVRQCYDWKKINIIVEMWGEKKDETGAGENMFGINLAESALRKTNKLGRVIKKTIKQYRENKFILEDG